VAPIRNFQKKTIFVEIEILHRLHFEIEIFIGFILNNCKIKISMKPILKVGDGPRLIRCKETTHNHPN
jgi:hypothetical protein